MSDLNMPGEDDGIQGDEPPPEVEGEEHEAPEGPHDPLGRTPPPPD